MLPVELRRVPLFAAMTPAELAAITAAARSSDYAHGGQMFRTGDPCADVIVVLRGYVRLFRFASGGAEVTTGIVRPGGLVAVTALCGGTNHDGEAQALGRVRTIEIPAPTFLGLVGRSPRLFAEVAVCLASRISDAYADATVAAQEELPSRILRTLRRLALPNSGEGHPQAIRPLAVRLSHAEVARLVQADRASVTRSLRLLEERGVIGRRQGHVTGVVLAVASEGARRGDRPRTTAA